MAVHIEEKVSGETLFRGNVIDLNLDKVRLENGKIVDREIVVHSGGACVLAINESDEIALVRQFRYAAGKELIEIPAGKLEIGEDPMEAAGREIIEETGYAALNLQPFGKIIPTCAYCTEIIYIYKATRLEKSVQSLDEDEFLDAFWLPFEEALDMVFNGEIEDSKTCCAILREAAQRKKSE